MWRQIASPRCSAMVLPSAGAKPPLPSGLDSTLMRFLPKRHVEPDAMEEYAADDVDYKDVFNYCFDYKLLNDVEGSEDQCSGANKIQREQHLEI